MALFKPFMGNRASLDAVEKHAGYVYLCVDDGSFHLDFLDDKGRVQRKQINANEANKLVGYDITTILDDSNATIPTSSAVLSALKNKSDVGHSHAVNDVNGLSDVITDLSGSIATNYNESIIGLSIDGQVITYIKGDGTSHTIVTQDTDTTYSIGTDTTTGLTKLYATTGSADDGTMTQRAIKTELDKKVSVSVDDTSDMLIFTI